MFKKLLILSLLLSFNLAHAMMMTDELFSFGLMFGQVSSEQKDLNSLRSAANTRAGGLSLSNLTSAWEAGVFAQLRVPQSMIAFQIRPAYFFQSETDTGGDAPYDGTYEYSTTGMNVSFLFKLYPMEAEYMRMFFQMGVVWGTLDTVIQENDLKVEANGHNLGYVGGLGIEMFFGTHKVFFEAGWRFLEIEQNMINSSSGTALEAEGSLSQWGDNQELEYKDKNLKTNMSGVQLLIGYAMTF